jgi:hypothetical protein
MPRTAYEPGVLLYATGSVDVDCGHRGALTRIDDMQKGHSFVVGAAGAACG